MELNTGEYLPIKPQSREGPTTIQQHQGELLF